LATGEADASFGPVPSSARGTSALASGFLYLLSAASSGLFVSGLRVPLRASPRASNTSISAGSRTSLVMASAVLASRNTFFFARPTLLSSGYALRGFSVRAG